MEQTDDPQDLHELVTLEPSIEDYAHMNGFLNGEQEAAQPDEEGSTPQSPLFSHPYTASAPDNAHPDRVHDAPNPRRNANWPSSLVNPSSVTSLNRSSLHEQSRSATDSIGGLIASMEAPRITLTPNAYGSRIPNVEKEIDDLEESYQTKRRSMFRQNTSTSTRVNRLFGIVASPAASRAPSFQKQPGAFSYTRSQLGETASLPHHLFIRGLLEGKHSDITIKAFGHSYKLHRIILDRAPFFASALSEPWYEASQKEVQLHPEEVDPHITQVAFELALKRLYGCALQAEQDEEAMGLFATGCWLEMQDLIDDSVESILKRMGPNNVAPVIQVVTANYYGKPGDRVLASAKAMLCRNGSDMSLRVWDGVPSDLVQEQVGSDGFFVRDEWSRWRLAKRLLDRRLKTVARDIGLWNFHPTGVRDRALRPPLSDTIDQEILDTSSSFQPRQAWDILYGHPDIHPLLKLLDHGIHYMHMDFEQLQSIRNARDVLGFPVLPGHIISNALWSSLELRQKVLNTSEKELTLGLMHYTHEEVSDKTRTQHRNSTHTQASQTADAASQNTPHQGDLRIHVDHFEDSVPDPPGRFIIPSADCNVVLGGTEEPVYTCPNSDTRHAVEPTSVGTGPDEGTRTLDMGLQSKTPSDRGRTITYSDYPPFRFAVEFPNSRMLKERRKVFSHTVFYAGSLWNVYIKKVKSSTRNPHLGVYLHRAPQHQNARSGTTQRGSVDERIGALEHRIQQRGLRPGNYTTAPTYLSYEQNMLPQDATQPNAGAPSATPAEFDLSDPASGRIPSRRQPPGSKDSNIAQGGLSSFNVNDDSEDDSDSSDNEMPDLDSLTLQPRSQVATLTPYVDSRPTIKTYFKIYSPSRGGRMLSVYESVPDDFNFSQSWGWKSSSLMIDEDEDEDEVPLPGPETSFVDDDVAGAELLDAGQGKAPTSAGEQELLQTKTSERRTTEGGGGQGLRFMVVLGVV